MNRNLKTAAYTLSMPVSSWLAPFQLFPAKVMTPDEYAERRADMEVVKQRSQLGGSEVRLSSFDDGVYARDAVSFFKATPTLVTEALHIVAHARGSAVCKGFYLGTNLAC